MRIECKDIEYVLAVSRLGSLAAAAEELFITQPALSKYIRNLEKRIGTDLFQHNKRPLTLTEMGKLYIGYAKEMNVLIANLDSEMEHLKHKEHECIRIGYACNGLRQYVYQASQKIRKEYPNVSITLTELTSPDIENRLLAGQLEFGFITLPARSNELKTQFIMEEEILLGVPASHPYASMGTPCSSSEFPTISLAMFQKDIFVLRDAGTRFHDSSNILFRDAGFTPNVATTARNNFSCIESAEEWGVCTLTTKSFSQYLKHPDSMRFFIAGPRPQKICSGLVYPKGKELSFLSGELIQYLCSQVSEKEIKYKNGQ